MKLWVRSQNRTALTEINEIIVNSNQDKNKWFVINYFGESQTYLGIYKTKKRALEILDEIQTLIDQVNDPNLTILPILLYEMPKE